MSAQIIEILFFAGIAFLIINKFISILGTTDEDDPAKKMGSIFGEPGGMKDVTNSATNSKIVKVVKKAKKQNYPEHLEGIYNIFPDFNVEKFLKGAKGAFSMIVEALDKKDLGAIEDLVDKRYIDQIKELDKVYGAKSGKLEASIVDSYSLGNSVYVKVLFKGATSKIKALKEEWVFTKNIQQMGPDWHLSNIDR